MCNQDFSRIGDHIHIAVCHTVLIPENIFILVLFKIAQIGCANV